MAVKRRYEGLIEQWPDEALLYVRALPGFRAAAPNRDELIEIALPFLDLHLEWLESHGYPPAIEDEGGLAVMEELPSTGKIGPLFRSDLLEPDGDEIELNLALARVSLSDMIELVDVLPLEQAESDEVAQILRKATVREIWFAARLPGPSPRLKPIADPLDGLIAAAGFFENGIDEFVETGATGVFARDGEDWTLAKLLRRRAAFLREYALDLVALSSDE